MTVNIVGGKHTSEKRARQMVADGIATWCIDSRSGLVSSTRIELVQRDRVNEPVVNLGPVIAQPNIVDAFPGHPVLMTIGYDRRTPGSYQKAA